MHEKSQDIEERRYLNINVGYLDDREGYSLKLLLTKEPGGLCYHHDDFIAYSLADDLEYYYEITEENIIEIDFGMGVCDSGYQLSGKLDKGKVSGVLNRRGKYGFRVAGYFYGEIEMY